MYKPLAVFKTITGFFNFEHILNLNHCRVFETDLTFPFLYIIRNLKQTHFHNLQNKSLDVKIILLRLN